jgi:AraC family transcriptional regulator
MNYHPPGELHSSHYIPGSSARIMIIEINGQELRWIRDFCSLTEDSLGFDGGRQTWSAARVYEELLHSDEVSPLILEGLVLELLAEILRGGAFKSVKKAPGWLVRAEELVQARFLERLTLREIGEEVGIHPVNLAQEYRRRYHRTIGSHMRQLRIEYASRQILQTDLPMVEIALASGFSDQSSFTVAFKNVTGITPSAYRRISRPANRSKSY